MPVRPGAVAVADAMTMKEHYERENREQLCMECCLKVSSFTVLNKQRELLLKTNLYESYVVS